MRAQSRKSGERKIRPGIWRPSVLIPATVLAGIFIWLSVRQPILTPAAVGVFVLIFLMGWLVSRPVHLDIGEVLVRAVEKRGKPVTEVPRSEIRVIRYYPLRISFRGRDDEPLMEIDPQWTVRQMLKVAEELQVPLYNHKGGPFGMEELSEGRLVNPSPSRQSVPGED